jgi:hypothetical protein
VQHPGGYKASSRKITLLYVLFLLRFWPRIPHPSPPSDASSCVRTSTLRTRKALHLARIVCRMWPAVDGGGGRGTAIPFWNGRRRRGPSGCGDSKWALSALTTLPSIPLGTVAGRSRRALPASWVGGFFVPDGRPSLTVQATQPPLLRVVPCLVWLALLPLAACFVEILICS